MVRPENQLQPITNQPGIKLGSGLLPLNILMAILVAVVILLPSNVLRIILGIPFLLFSPGYALVAAIYTRSEGMGGIERVGYSFGLSIVLVPFIAYILNYTPLGIRLEPVTYSVASVIFITSIVAWLRRRRLTAHERFNVYLRMAVSGWNRLGVKILTIAVAIAILGTVGTLVYTQITPKEKESFTEFYVLGPQGTASVYPLDVKVGEENTLYVGIINHEGKETSYRVELIVDGEKISDIGPVEILNEEKWETKVTFVAQRVGTNQKVDLILYKDREVEPYLEPLRLPINVIE
jgi:uncharacterized membrane protein